MHEEQRRGWKDMITEDAQQVATLRKQNAILGPGRSSRGFSKVVTMSTAWVRRKQVVLENTLVEFDKRLFWREMKSLGYKPETQKRLANATSDKMVRAKRAKKKGGKWIILHRLPRKTSATDILE